MLGSSVPFSIVEESRGDSAIVSVAI